MQRMENHPPPRAHPLLPARNIIPDARKQMRPPHKHLLARRALDILKEQLEEIKQMNTTFIFPSHSGHQSP